MKVIVPKPKKLGKRALAKAKKEAAAAKAAAAAKRAAAPKKPAVLIPKYSRSEMKRLLEAVLFAADRPVMVSQLCSVLSGAPDAEVRATLTEMATEYEEWGRSFTLKEVGGGFLFSTHPAFEPWVRKLFKGRLTLRLSRSALETVALIAYRQPLTKQEIETIRGVNADGVLATLLDRKLVRVTGRKEGSTALLYGTTGEFLQYMGLNDLGDLPQIEEMKAILDAQEAPSLEGAAAHGPYAGTSPGEAPATDVTGMPPVADSAGAEPAAAATEETAEETAAADTSDLAAEDGAPGVAPTPAPPAEDTKDEKPKDGDDEDDDEDDDEEDEDDEEDGE